MSGNYLVSRAVSSEVPSASERLTAVFGMGTGGSVQASSPHTECCPLKTSQKKLPCKLFLLGKTTLANHTAKSQSTFASQTSTKWLTQNCSFALAHAVLVRYLAVNVIQSHVAFARVLGTFSHTTCFPLSFILRIRFSDRSVSQALDRLVLVSSTHCCASTSSLSTSSSSRGLTSF